MVLFIFSLCGKDFECFESISVVDDDIIDFDIVGIGVSKIFFMNVFLGMDFS